MPEEHQAPKQITPKRLDDYLEIMSKSVFQTGMSWKVIDNKWPGIREAMRDFDADAVATLSERDIDALVQDTRVIRNRRKLEAIAGNAMRMIELHNEHGSFRDYLRSFDDYDALEKDLRKQFKFLGVTGCYIFLYVVREQVPPYEEWRESRGI